MQGRKELLLVALYYRIWDKFRPDGMSHLAGMQMVSFFFFILVSGMAAYKPDVCGHCVYPMHM